MKTFQDLQKQKLSQGSVLTTEDQLVTVSGLPGVLLNEKILLENGSEGFIFSINEDSNQVVLVQGTTPIPGTNAVRTNETITFPASEHLLGKIVSPLGVDYVSSFQMKVSDPLEIELKAAGISKRAKIKTQCLTGSLLVDTLLPLGMGQRELLLGDRKTGKTQFAKDALITQAKLGSICIYVSIGKPLASVKAMQRMLKEQECWDQVVIIASSPEDPAGLILLTPFSGMRLAEYFRDIGKNVFLVLDDLTTHARAYRQLSLLARRFPGRNAYPGDIFYLHARLLERAGNFKINDTKSVSITCLPIAETEQGDLTGYIQTNLMSMTDGHLYFDEERFLEGARPAIHPFLSVTRVGRQTKTPLMRETISTITSFLSQTERLSQISHFGQELSTEAKDSLHKAEKLSLLFKLPNVGTYTSWFQFFIIALVWDGYWLGSPNDTLLSDLHRLHALTSKQHELKEKVKKISEADSLLTASHLARKTADEIFKTNP